MRTGKKTRDLSPTQRGPAFLLSQAILANLQQELVHFALSAQDVDALAEVVTRVGEASEALLALVFDDVLEAGLAGVADRLLAAQIAFEARLGSAHAGTYTYTNLLGARPEDVTTKTKTEGSSYSSSSSDTAHTPAPSLS